MAAQELKPFSRSQELMFYEYVLGLNFMPFVQYNHASKLKFLKFTL